MPDPYTTNMREHMSDCYQAHGMSPAGADQLANHQAPTSAIDQAMMGSYNTPSGSPGALSGAGNTAQDQTAYGVPMADHGYDSYPDSTNNGGNVWGNPNTGSTPAESSGGNVWGSDGSNAGVNETTNTGNIW